jgi:uncharacterized membrane protein
MWHRAYGPAPWAIIVIGGLGLALAAAAIAVAVWVVTQRGSRPTPSVRNSGRQQYPSSVATAGSGPLRILEERLARGEIDVDTYRAVRAELAPSAQPVPDSQAAQAQKPPN